MKRLPETVVSSHAVAVSVAIQRWAFNGTQRVQFRADFINAFNHTQWLADPLANGLDNTCTASLATCNPGPPADTFGQILNTRAPNEIQLGLKFYW